MSTRTETTTAAANGRPPLLLGQVVALVGGTKSRTERALTAAHHEAQRTPQLSGISRSYVPLDDEGERLPSESTQVQVRVPDLVDDFRAALRRLFDVVATQEWGNTQARADVMVDGRVIIEQAPVTLLMFLTHKLADLRTFVTKLPTLDPAETWEYDENLRAYRSAVVQTSRSKKIPRNHVKAEATDRHPAQVDVWFEDVAVGTWSTIRYSGAWPAAKVREVAERVDRLIDAVKVAHEAANATLVEDHAIGSDILGYVFG